MTRLYIDMDGTLARFYAQDNAVEKYRTEDDYFLNLDPYLEMASAVRMLLRDGIDVVILSSVDSDIRISSVSQKDLWLTNIFGRDNTPPALYPETGTDKAEYIRRIYGEIGPESWLIDDYTRNLLDWSAAGGRAIKAINEINGLGGKWNGPRVNILTPANDLYREIKELITA